MSTCWRLDWITLDSSQTIQHSSFTSLCCLELLARGLIPTRVIQISKQLDAPLGTRVTQAVLLILLANLLQLLLGKLNLERLAVRNDVRVLCALGNHARAPLNTPRQHGLEDGNALLGGDVDPELILVDGGQVVTVRRVRVGERGVGDDLDALFLVPVDKLLLLEVRVGFEFVGVGLDFRRLEDRFDVGFGKVGEANVAG